MANNKKSQVEDIFADIDAQKSLQANPKKRKPRQVAQQSTMSASSGQTPLVNGTNLDGEYSVSWTPPNPPPFIYYVDIFAEDSLGYQSERENI